jgi:hypothetical protein
VTEEDQLGGHGAELHDRRERCAGVLPARHGRHDAQMRAARDGQELGQALEEAKDEDFEGAQRRWRWRRQEGPTGGPAS